MVGDSTELWLNARVCFLLMVPLPPPPPSVTSHRMPQGELSLSSQLYDRLRKPSFCEPNWWSSFAVTESSFTGAFWAPTMTTVPGFVGSFVGVLPTPGTGHKDRYGANAGVTLARDASVKVVTVAVFAARSRNPS